MSSLLPKKIFLFYFISFYTGVDTYFNQMKQEANHRLDSTTFGKGDWFLMKFLNFVASASLKIQK